MSAGTTNSPPSTLNKAKRESSSLSWRNVKWNEESVNTQLFESVVGKKIYQKILAAGPVNIMNKPLLKHIFTVFEVIQNTSDWVSLVAWMGPYLWAWIISWV